MTEGGDGGRRFWDADAQTMPRERLRELQDNRVRALMQRIFEVPVPLFRRKLAEAGIASSRRCRRRR